MNETILDVLIYFWMFLCGGVFGYSLVEIFSKWKTRSNFEILMSRPPERSWMEPKPVVEKDGV